MTARAVRRGAATSETVQVPVLAVALDDAQFERRALLRELFEGTPPATPVAEAVEAEAWRALSAHQRTLADFDAWARACAVAADRAGRIFVTDPHPNRRQRM